MPEMICPRCLRRKDGEGTVYCECRFPQVAMVPVTELQTARKARAAVGKKNADRAIVRVDRNADDEWKAAALHAVKLVASRQGVFTTDDVWDVIPRGYATPENRAMGPVMRKAESEGWCRPRGDFVPARREGNHQRPLRVWSSLILGEQVKPVPEPTIPDPDPTLF
jgi:hypothetical protein